MSVDLLVSQLAKAGFYYKGNPIYRTNTTKNKVEVAFRGERAEMRRNIFQLCDALIIGFRKAGIIIAAGESPEPDVFGGEVRGYVHDILYFGSENEAVFSIECQKLGFRKYDNKAVIAIYEDKLIAGYTANELIKAIGAYIGGKNVTADKKC